MSSGFGDHQILLSSTCFTEELCLIVGGFHLQEISFVPALEKTGSAFGIFDEIKLGFFELECIDIISCVDITAVEEELMSRNREQRLGEFLDLGQQKILDILTGENDRGLHTSKGENNMKKQYLYPQNMRTEAKLWFWGLKDIIILAIALTISVVSWAKLNFVVPAALTLIYGFLSMRLDDCSVLDFIKRAARYFLTTQQYFEWKESRHGK